MEPPARRDDLPVAVPAGLGHRVLTDHHQPLIVCPWYTPAARRLGIASATGIVLLSALYAGVTAAGLLSLTSPVEQIGDPYFSAMEILILLMAPLMVALFAAIHAWATPDSRTLSLAALAFMVGTAVVTMSVHFAILTVSRHPRFVEFPWNPMLFSFEWPSIAYALDILAWDVFFALSVLCAAPVFTGSGLPAWVRRLLIASGILAVAGLSGILTSDMQLRSIGILGYALVFPIAVLLLALLFIRTPHAPENFERLDM
jgi:hypothetical protein